MCARDPNQTVSSSQSKYDVTIPISLIFCWEQLNEPCGVKNLRSQFVYANPAYLKLLGLPLDFDISGRLDSEIPAPTAEFASQFQIHDRDVEWDVIFLLLQNHTQKEIGGLLFKSVGYVNNIVNNIYTKCGVHNIHQFRDLSKAHGWINYVPEKFLINRHAIINI